MKILTAIDSMKGSMTSMEANTIIEEVFLSEQNEVKKIAIADGGEGTVAAFLENCKGEQKQAPAHDLCGNKMMATFAWIDSEKLAVIESADTAGIQFLAKNKETHPSHTNSFGVGETIWAALNLGAKKIIIGLGGTGTIDGGIGAMSALGAEFFDSEGKSLKPVGGNLGRIFRIAYENVHALIHKTEFILATDVHSYLTGQQGAVQMFGQQKGIKHEEQKEYEDNLIHYQNIVADKEHLQFGDGAAGGLGIGLRILLKAQVESGLNLLSQYAGLSEEMKKAELVITGEGKMDPQSLQGKVPIGISKLAKRYEIPVIAFVGTFEGDLNLFKKAGIDVVVPIVNGVSSLGTALAKGPSNLRKAAIMTKSLIELQMKIHK